MLADLRSILHDALMSRANTIVAPGGKMDLAMQLVFTPMIWRLMARRNQAIARLGPKDNPPRNDPGGTNGADFT